MYGAGLNVFAVWNYIITKTHHGVIELNPKMLANTLGGEPREIEDAIEFLCKPDSSSRTKAEGGRRLVKEGEFQYRVVNWEVYHGIKSEEARREYNRVAQVKHRAKQRMKSKGGGTLEEKVEDGQEPRATRPLNGDESGEQF